MENKTNEILLEMLKAIKEGNEIQERGLNTISTKLDILSARQEVTFASIMLVLNKLSQ